MIVAARANAVVLCLALSLLLGCGGKQTPASHVVAYVAVDRQDAEPVLEAFTKQTGIEVRAVYDAEFAKTTGLATRLVAEAERPRCDVFWNNENVQTLLLASRGLLAEYRSPSAVKSSPDDQDPSGRWTAVATRARVIVYNTRYVTAGDAPRSIFDLTKPQWRGKVAIANPQFGTTRTHAAALFAVLGADDAEKFFSELMANEVRVVDGNATVKNLVARADPDASPILVGLTDTDDVHSGQSQGESVELVYPDQDSIGTLVVPSTVCIVRGSPNPEAARRLVDYLVGGEAALQLTARNSGYQPVQSVQPDGKQVPTVKSFALAPEKLLEQLEPSTRWTAENFRP